MGAFRAVEFNLDLHGQRCNVAMGDLPDRSTLLGMFGLA